MPGDGHPDGVTDEDRNRYGLLLDRAAERGLLPPAEYEVRLMAMAEATTVDELQRLVTELPAFGDPSPVAAPPGGAGPGAQRRPEGDPAAWILPTPTPARAKGKKGASSWLVLVVVVTVLAVALVALALVARNVARTRPSPVPGVVAPAGVSSPRP
jgi:hypothetical protein